jgi:regulator of sirC expression with transglutaminase-like and TPR domain
MDTGRSPRQRFTDLAALPDDRIDLAEAALLIAAEAYPALDLPAYLGRLDSLATGARDAVAEARSSEERARCLLHYLSVEQNFTGNRNDYYDPRNSFLNDVLDRRTGIPITLALVYVEVGRRVGLPVRGVGFPGHFLAKYAAETDVIIDPFFGQILDARQCLQRLRAIYGPQARLEPQFFRAARPREILVRMLGNLKHVYLQTKSFESALTCCERLLLLAPDAAHELRDRGLLYEQLECHRAAQIDLERFLELAPDDPTADIIRAELVEIRLRASRLH